METWAVVENLTNYEISNFGRVKSKKRRMEKILNSKYGQVMLYDTDGYRMNRIHRLVANAFIPNPENLPDVRHIDGDPANNMVKNLEWFNQKANRLNNIPTAEHIKKLQRRYNFTLLE